MGVNRIFDLGTGEFRDEEYTPEPVSPALSPAPVPVVFASIGVVIDNGQVSILEMPANIQSVTYEEGWLLAVFSEAQTDTAYQIFALVDKPAQIEQFKSEGYFELIFSDGNGNPVEPLRADIQILKVR